MAKGKQTDVELVVSAKNEATKTINELVDALEKLGKEAGTGAAGLFKKLSESSDDLAQRQDELTGALKRAKQAQTDLAKSSAQREKDLARQQDQIDKTRSKLDELNRQYDEYAAAANKARQPSDKLVETFRKQRETQQSLADSIQKTAIELREAQNTLQQNGGVDEQASARIEKQRQKVIELGQAWRQTQKAVAEAKAVLEQRTVERDTGEASQKAAQARLDALRQELQAARELEKVRRQEVREADEASDEQVKARQAAITATQKLREAIAEQVLVERQARQERDASARSFRQQNTEVEKLVTQAGKQKAAYKDLQSGLDTFEKSQRDSGIDKQEKRIASLTDRLKVLQDQYETAGTKIAATQDRLNQATGPDPVEVSKFDRLKQTIRETEQEILEQTASLEKLQGEYRDAGAGADDLTQQQQRLEAITERLTREQSELNQEVTETAGAVDKSGKAATTAGRRFRTFGDDTRQTLSFLQRIRGELLSIAAAYTGVFAVGGAVRSIYDASVLTTKATARLNAKLNGDMQAIEKEIRFVREEADRLGIEFETLLDQYTKFVNNVPDGSLTLDQIRFTFSGIAEASRAAGLGTQDIQSVFVALGQIASKGAVQLEELRQQLGERIPAAIENTAKGLTDLTGELVTTEDLLARINRGEVSSDAIVALAKSLKDEFGPSLATALDSPLASLGRFKNALFDIRLELAQSGFIDELSRGLGEITKQLRTEEFKDGARQFAQGLSAAVRFVVLLVQNFESVLVVLQAIAAVKLASYFRTAALSGVEFAEAMLKGKGAADDAYTATTRLGRGLQRLLSTVLVLPAAFAAGFAVGDILQREFPAIQKLGIWMVAIFEQASLKINELWAIAVANFKGGWVEGAKYVARLIIDQFIKVADVVAPTIGAKLREALEAGVLGSNEGVAAQVKKIREDAEAARATVDKIIADMLKDINKDGPKVLDPEQAKKDVQQYTDAIAEGLDFFQTGVNAGKGLTEGLLTQLENIERALKEETAGTLEKRLALIQDEYQKFLDGVANFDATSSDQIVEIQEKAQKRIDEIKANASLKEEVRAREIAAIQKRAAQEIAKIQEGQAALAGASDVAKELIEVRQEKERQAFFDKQSQEAQKQINDLIKARQDEQSRVNDLAEVNLISQEEQGRRLTAINDEYLGKIRQAVDAAKELARETGNSNLSNFLSGFDNFEAIEKRRAKLDEIGRLEEQINDILDLRENRLSTINLLRENGAIGAAEAERQVNQIYNETEEQLGGILDKAIALAQTLKDPQLVASLEALRGEFGQLKQQVFDAETLSADFASGFTGAFDAFIQGTKTAGEAFRSFIADFLRQIANAIIQALILKAITGSFSGGAGGAGGAVAGGLNSMFNHTGGVVGTHGTRRTVDASAFLGAVRYHSGGIAGLKPDEVPTVLQKGEEVLTRDDPRHRMNGGQGQGQNIKIVNAIDSASIVSEGLNNAQGQKAILNFMRANKASIKSVLT